MIAGPYGLTYVHQVTSFGVSSNCDYCLRHRTRAKFCDNRESLCSSAIAEYAANVRKARPLRRRFTIKTVLLRPHQPLGQHRRPILQRLDRRQPLPRCLPVRPMPSVAAMIRSPRRRQPSRQANRSMRRLRHRRQLTIVPMAVPPAAVPTAASDVVPNAVSNTVPNDGSAPRDSRPLSQRLQALRQPAVTTGKS